MARRSAEEELEIENEYEEESEPEVEEEVDEDDDRPQKKVKAKSVKAKDEEEAEEEVESEEAEETSKPVAKKKKVSRRTEEVEEESPKPKLVKKAVKKGGKTAMEKTKTEKQHRSPRRADWPYGDKSLVGRIFNKAEKTGIALKLARKMCEEEKQAKTPSYWVLTDIRRGQWKTAAGLWKWDVDTKALAKGFLKVSNVRLVKLKAKKAA